MVPGKTIMLATLPVASSMSILVDCYSPQGELSWCVVGYRGREASMIEGGHTAISHENVWRRLCEANKTVRSNWVSNPSQRYADSAEQDPPQEK